MVQVSYENRIGSFKMDSNDGGISWEIWFCRANCMCAMMYFYDEIRESGEIVPMVQLHGFFSDFAHAKRCIKDGVFDRCHDFVFDSKNMSNDIWKMVKEIVKSGVSVTIK